MGNGEVSGNQSVHWRIDHGTKPRVNQGNPNRPTGDDEINVDTIVQGRDPRKSDAVAVRMRFKDQAEWDAALKNARQETLAGHLYVTVHVPLLTRQHPDDAPPADLRFDWDGTAAPPARAR